MEAVRIATGAGAREREAVGSAKEFVAEVTDGTFRSSKHERWEADKNHHVFVSELINGCVTNGRGITQAMQRGSEMVGESG